VGKNPRLSFLTVDGPSQPTHHLPLFIFLGPSESRLWHSGGGGHLELFFVGPICFEYGVRKMPAPVLQAAVIPCLRAS
jgi:hypothetical protein